MGSPIKIGVSSCLLGEPVRYDGGHKHYRYLTDVLATFADEVLASAWATRSTAVTRTPSPVYCRKRSCRSRELYEVVNELRFNYCGGNCRTCGRAKTPLLKQAELSELGKPVGLGILSSSLRKWTRYSVSIDGRVMPAPQ